ARRVAAARVGPGEAVTGEVERDDAVIAFQRARPALPGEDRAVRAVQEHDGGAGAAVAHVHAQAVDVDELRGGGGPAPPAPGRRPGGPDHGGDAGERDDEEQAEATEEPACHALIVPVRGRVSTPSP